MNKILIVPLIFVWFFANAAESPITLESMKNDIVKEKVEQYANKPPQLKNMGEEVLEDNKKIRITFSRKDCVAQGNTRDECELLAKNNKAYLDDYDLKNPDIPDIQEATENLFINIQIKN